MLNVRYTPAIVTIHEGKEERGRKSFEEEKAQDREGDSIQNQSSAPQILGFQFDSLRRQQKYHPGFCGAADRAVGSHEESLSLVEAVLHFTGVLASTNSTPLSQQAGRVIIGLNWHLQEL